MNLQLAVVFDQTAEFVRSTDRDDRFHYATIHAANISRIEMTKSEAKSTVEEKLRKQQLTKPMTETEMTVFCQAMLRNLELETKGALSEIRGWAESWQATRFR